MSRKDYAALAAVIEAFGKSGGDTGTLVAVVIRMGMVFGADNAAYAHEKFVTACGLSLDVAGVA